MFNNPNKNLIYFFKQSRTFGFIGMSWDDFTETKMFFKN